MDLKANTSSRGYVVDWFSHASKNINKPRPPDKPTPQAAPKIDTFQSVPSSCSPFHCVILRAGQHAHKAEIKSEYNEPMRFSRNEEGEALGSNSDNMTYAAHAM